MTEASVFSDVVCELGEGPSAHPERGVVTWFDILGRRLLEKPFDGSGTRVHDLPFHGSVMAVVDGGRQLIGSDAGLHLRDLTTGRFERVAELLAPGSGHRSNDGRVHPAGALWISTMSWTFEPGEGAIWWFREGRLEKIVDGLAIPNAISFAPDGTHAYFACSKAGIIWRIPTDPATGKPTGERKVFVAGGEGGPDGAVVDADGLLWNARWGASSVHVYDTEGRLVRTVAMPATQCSCPAFVGAGADGMIVTSAREGLDAVALAADPLAGQTFRIDVPVRGRFDPPVKLA